MVQLRSKLLAICLLFLMGLSPYSAQAGIWRSCLAGLKKAVGSVVNNLLEKAVSARSRAFAAEQAYFPNSLKDVSPLERYTYLKEVVEHITPEEIEAYKTFLKRRPLDRAQIPAQRIPIDSLHRQPQPVSQPIVQRRPPPAQP